MKGFNIVKVTPDHAEILIPLVHEFSESLKKENYMTNTAEKLRKDIEKKAVHGFVAFDGEDVAGINLFYYSYTTWVGQFIHMDTLYVRPKYRRMGLGRTLWKHLAKFAVDTGITRLEWSVLDGNKDAIAFYNTAEHVNLMTSEGWHMFSMNNDAISKLINEVQ